MSYLVRATVCIAVFSMSAACYAHGPSVSANLRERTLTVEVRNYNFYDATIYAFHRGEKLRLGMAQGKSTTDFEFRWDLGDLRFVIDFIGAGELVGELIAVEPGDRLLLIVRQEDHRRAIPTRSVLKNTDGFHHETIGARQVD